MLSHLARIARCSSRAAPRVPRGALVAPAVGTSIAPKSDVVSPSRAKRPRVLSSDDFFHPLAPLSQLHRGMDSLVRDAFGPFWGGAALNPWRVFDQLERQMDSAFAPSRFGLEMPRTLAIDVVERADHFELQADVPGVKREDISVDVEDDVLTISVEKSRVSEDGAKAVSEKAGSGAAKEGEAAATGSEAKTEKAEDDQPATWHRVERSFGRITRSMRLPETADVAKISAKHENGVLTVRIPKKPEEVSKPKTKVSIQ